MRLYFALLQVTVELLALKELLHLCLDQHPAHVDDLVHCQGEALHRVAELLLNTIRRAPGEKGSHRCIIIGLIQGFKMQLCVCNLNIQATETFYTG